MHSIVCLVVIAAIIITAICIIWNYHNSIIRDSGTYLEVIFEKPLYSITNKELLEYYRSCGSDAISSDYRYWCKARRRAINRVCYNDINIDNMSTVIKENKKLKRKCKKTKRLLNKRKKWQGNIFKIIFAIIIAIIAYKYGKKNNNQDNTVLWNQQ